MRKRKQLSAFTLIELAVVFSIIAILATLAFGSILNSLPRMRVRGDVRNVNQIMLRARMLSISENAHYGVAFYQTGSSAPCTYYYFVFKDVNSDGQFTDLDGDPLNQCEIIDTCSPYYPGCKVCTAGGEDPIIGILQLLNSKNFFDLIFGSSLASTNPNFVVFGPLGDANRGGDIIIQSNTLLNVANHTSYAGRVRLNQASGSTTRIPPSIRPHP